jgi:hypothetical protein
MCIVMVDFFSLKRMLILLTLSTLNAILLSPKSSCLSVSRRLSFRRGATIPLREPVDFYSNFKIEVNEGELNKLEKLNQHQTDKKVSFDEAKHQYFYEGELMALSVTSLIAQYFEKFESEAVAERMIAGKRWPRVGYIHEDGRPYSKSEVLQQWDYVGETASNQGTWMHYNIERYLNGEPPADNLPELQQFMEFYQDVVVALKYTPYRTEWRIVAPDLSLAGSVDLVVQKGDGTFAIIDWKRSKNLPDNMKSVYGKKAMGPLRNLPDCDGSKYFLQQNIYKYILEKYYGIKITSLLLVSMHPEFDKYFLVDVPCMEKEVLRMIDDLTSTMQQDEPHICDYMGY